MSPGSKHRSLQDERRRLAGRRGALQLRARLTQTIRAILSERGYLEVETPVLIPAPAPEQHIDPIGMGERFLHTSPELCMKRLLAAGFPKIFQIVKCFRKGERGTLHLPEFTLLEWYRAGIDYMALMQDCQSLIRRVARQLALTGPLQFHGRQIRLERPWERITVHEAFRRYTCATPREALEQGRFSEIMVTEVEPHLGKTQPTFLYDFPASLASLARLKRGEGEIAERFELYLGGLEVANGFSELTDPEEQRARFEKELEKRRGLGKQAMPMPERFLRALKDMPEAAGLALGIDRLVMLFYGTEDIDQVVTFTPEEI